MTNQISAHRRRGERGQTIIEAGVTVVLLFGLIFLVMDLSMLLFIRSTLQQAVREGVRYGATGSQYGGNVYLNDSIRAAVQANALGFLNGPAGACRVGVNYYAPDTGAASPGTQGDVVVVSVNNYNYTPLGAVLKRSDPFMITVSSSDIVERCPIGGCPITANPDAPPCP